MLGTLSDSWGRRLPLFISVAGSTAPFILLALTNEPSVYLVSLGLSGLTAGTFPIVFACVSDTFDGGKEEQGETASKTAAFGLAQVAD